MANIDKLFARIAELNLTAKKVSEATGISTGNLSDWKSGRCLPSAEKLEKLANCLDCSVDYLLGRTDTPTRPQGSGDIEEEVVVYCRNGKTTRKKLTKEQMEYLDKFISSFGEEDYPDL